MAAKAPVAGSNSTAVAKRPVLPPEEKFWQRYSPNHEFSLSGVGSFTIYVLAILAIFIGLKYTQLFDDAPPPLPMDSIDVAGGGGGNPDGSGDGPGDGKLVEAGTKTTPTDTNLTGPQPKELIKPTNNADVAEILPNYDGQGFVDEAGSQLDKITKVLNRDAAKDLMAGLGKGGTGSGGGEGTGTGTGKGDAKGPGTGTRKGSLNEREARVLRWQINFDSRHGGEDYRVQLAALGAILAYPAADGKYMVIEDLKPPVRPILKDLKEIKRIFWVDDRPESVRNLAMALGLPSPPQHIVAFFPEKLEQQLALKETNFRGRPVNQIKETKFQVVQRGPKQYDVIVMEQR